MTDSLPGLPAVSVLVPFHNSEKHIASCIEALLSQNSIGSPVELLFIDNGSSDGSANIVRRYPEVQLLDEKTPGAYAARNRGLRSAQAPLIAFTDADCVADEDWLSRIVATMENPEVAVAIGHCRYPTQASWPLRWLETYENTKAEYVLQRCPAAFHFAYANNMAVRSSVFDDIGAFEEWRRAGDTELVHRLATRRPDLQTVFAPTMRVTHHEFVTLRARAARLSLYTETNSRIETFRELTLGRRLGVLFRTLARMTG